MCFHPRNTKQARSAEGEVNWLPGVREERTKMTPLMFCLGVWVGFHTSTEVGDIQEERNPRKEDTVSELPMSTGYRGLQSG